MSLLLLLKGGEEGSAPPSITGIPDRRRRIPGFDESRSRIVLGIDTRQRAVGSTDERRRMADENVS